MKAAAVIAEDEPLLRAEIRDAVHRVWPELEICAEVGDGIQAVQALESLAPDVLFLDIQMPGLSGIDVARHASGKAHIVFITAYDEHALTAFEYGAIDYLLKPVSIERLASAISRLRARFRDTPPDYHQLAELLKSTASARPQYLQWLTVPKGSELHVVALADIAFFRAENKYVIAATRTGDSLLGSSLKELLEKLDPADFWQIHRSYIVNVGAIDVIHRSFRGALELKVKGRNDVLPVSGTYAHRFKQF